MCFARRFGCRWSTRATTGSFYAEICVCRSISHSCYRTHGTTKGYGCHGGTEEKGWTLPLLPCRNPEPA